MHRIAFALPFALPSTHATTWGAHTTQPRVRSAPATARPKCRRLRADVRCSLQPLPVPVQNGADSGLPGAVLDTKPDISITTLLDIVYQKTDDAVVNDILRALLGWRMESGGDNSDGADDSGCTWNDSFVPEEWREAYPDGPPDFIGSADDYSPQTDRPVKKAVQKLTRSIPQEYKQISREVLSPHGFIGFKINELTPNRTRRATAVNWVLYYMKVHYPDHEW